MLLKSIVILVICNYMTEILNINMCKVCVNYKSLFIEATMLCIYVTCARQLRSSKLLVGEPLEYHGHVVMLINMAAEGNVNVKNLVQTIVQHLAFRETIN